MDKRRDIKSQYLRMGELDKARDIKRHILHVRIGGLNKTRDIKRRYFTYRWAR